MPASRSAAAAHPITRGRPRRLRANGVELCLDSYQLRVDNRTANLPLKEFELLRTLMENAGQARTHRQLLDTVWGADYPDDNTTLRVHIMRLRKKIEPDHNHPIRIRTVPHRGYIFDVVS